MDFERIKIAVIGLGYIGLPLAIEFAKHFPTAGYDVSASRISELKAGVDKTRELSAQEIFENLNGSLQLTHRFSDLEGCNIFIIAVPTPVDSEKKPDLAELRTACREVGKVLEKGALVIFESTTYPGCTEEICAPELEKASGLKYNEDFFLGYSPERISPGDKDRRLTHIVKLTSGSTPAAAQLVDELYRKIIDAGTYQAPSIKVAEAAKAIENAQRDLNISFMNELAIIFDTMQVDTQDVLDAAATKWNFINFKPGLVGGHCINVDPYYLVSKSKELGYEPEVILSGRRVNDGMGIFVADKVLRLMHKKHINPEGAEILILGFSFKENCPDFRNTKIIDTYQKLTDNGCTVTIVDPWTSPEEALEKHRLSIVKNLDDRQLFDGIILAVAHDDFLGFDVLRHKKSNAVVFDCKSVWDRNIVDARL